MLSTMGDSNRFILFNGHRLLSASKTMDNAKLGYDSKRRYKPKFIYFIYLLYVKILDIQFIINNL